MLATRAWELVISDSFGTDYAAPDETEAATLRLLASYAPVVLLTGRP